MSESLLFIKQDDASFYAKGEFNISDILSGSGGGGGGSSDPTSTIIFGSTEQVTVANTGSATTLFGAGEGELSIDAGTWDAGQKVVYEVRGKYGTSDTLPGSLSFLVKIGTALTLTVSITDLPFAQENALFKLTAEFVRLSEGGSGTVVGWALAELYTVNGDCIRGYAVTTSAETVGSSSTHVPDVQVDWSTASSANTITQQVGLIQKFGVVTP